MNAIWLTLQNLFRQNQFHLRQNILGPLKFRRGLPSEKLWNTSELRVYQSFLNALLKPQTESLDWVIDIGCRNFSYAPALCDFFPEAQILGIEVDGNRRFWNLYRRQDYAQAVCEALKKKGRNIHVLHGDLLDLNLHIPQNTLWTYFFPFVSDHPCLCWGLPLKFQAFDAHLMHLKTLNPLAKILSVHQGHWEWEQAKENYQNQGYTIDRTHRFDPSAPPTTPWPFPFEVYGCLASLSSPKRAQNLN